MRTAGFTVSKQSAFGGRSLAGARKALGLVRADAGKILSVEALMIQMLRPLRNKGKVARDRTTDFTNVWGRGVPGHQKGDARRLAKRMLLEGQLGEKLSVGQQHVWLTERGLARLALAEQSVDADS